jgi:hypothetical protein
VDKKLKIILLFVFYTAGVALSTGHKNNIAVLYHGETDINSDTIDFIREQFKRYKKINFRIMEFPVGEAKTVNPTDYRAVLLLNTNVRSGIDAAIARYINSFEEKSNLILITLLKDNKELKIRSIKPSSATLGVDAITGPSVWKDRGFFAYFGAKNNEEYDIHVEWVKRTLLLIIGKV